MTPADIRELVRLADLAQRIADDARSILRRRHLICDRRLAQARPSLIIAHRDMLWSFAEPRVEETGKDGGG